MSLLTALFILAALCSFTTCQHDLGLCELGTCICVKDKHPSWLIVKCTLNPNQKLDIFQGDLPETTTDLIITGAGIVMFAANSLSRLKDARRIYISGAEIIFMRTNAATNLDVLNLQLEIENCDVLRIEEHTFNKIKGPLSVSIRNCGSVSTDGPAFSWLLNLNITNVHSLQLGMGSFKLDPSAANVGEHGPGMSININNVTIPFVATQAFGSSAAEIVLENVKINRIQSEAFSANTYNIVLALNSSIENIDEDAFAQRSLINNLYFFGCRIQKIASRALQSAVGNLNISNSLIENIDSHAIETTVASVAIIDTEFSNIMENGVTLSSWTKLKMERNSFNELVPNAIDALHPSSQEQIAHELIFVGNEIETAHPNSLRFIGLAKSNPAYNVLYEENYYGQSCNCTITSWLAHVLGIGSGEAFTSGSFCTIDDFLARCFNEPEQNIRFEKFLNGLCAKKSLTFRCESYRQTPDGSGKEIKNPRFPHKNKQAPLISERDKKVIGIVIVTCLGCIVIVMFISFIRWMRRKGYCVQVKNVLNSSNQSCSHFCDRVFSCGATNGLDNARSISRLSVNEYSERHRLNEPSRPHDIVHESNNIHDELVPTEDKTTQTLPEQLTKEILENLKANLDNPENYAEARETIEHLYVLTKLEEDQNEPKLSNSDENIYELPFRNSTPYIGRNNREMKSVGTATPIWEKINPQSPYYRQTALAHEYFEPKDLAVHLYAEISNIDKEMRTQLGNMPDVVAEQAVPRGPYLRAMREKMNTSGASSSPPKTLSKPALQGSSSIKSTNSNTLAKMMNRPLPQKPITLDPGEGTSFSVA